MQEIESIIYSSSNLDGIEKVFLYNEELLNDVLPYYEGNSSTILTKLRHGDMDIVPFTEEDKRERPNSSGYFSLDNLLHILDYESSTQLQKRDIRKTVGHEYVHMLQVNFDLRFILESVACIVSNEYYLNSCEQYRTFPYDTDVRYTEVLMEIVGPEVVWDRVFRKDSKALEDAVRPYLSEDEFTEFFELLKKSRDKMVPREIDRVYSLLKTLYEIKYSLNMEDNELIMAIINKQECNRVYFRKSLTEDYPSYYVTTREEKLDWNIEELCENNRLECLLRLDLDSFEDWNDYQNENLIKKTAYLFDAKTGDKIDASNVRFEDGEFKGKVYISKTGEYPVTQVTDNVLFMSITDAIEDGLVNLQYSVSCRVSLEEFEKNIHNPMYSIELVNKNLYSGYYRFNRDDFTFSHDVEVKVYVDEIVGKDLSPTKKAFF